VLSKLTALGTPTFGTATQAVAEVVQELHRLDNGGFSDVQLQEAAAFGFSWVSCSFPTVEVGHKLAASLASTVLSEELINQVASPWPCFMIRVPAGVLGVGECWEIIDTTYLGEKHAKVRTLTCVNTGGASGCVAASGVHPSVSDLLTESNLLNNPGDVIPNLDLPRLERIYLLMNRIVCGVLVEMDSPEKKRAISKGPKYASGLDRHGLPANWNFKLTRPVKVDVREAVRDYVDGTRRGKLSLQHLVRGHHKMQRCGQGGSERKWIHVEPYWRGPEDAPIALRSHTLGD